MSISSKQFVASLQELKVPNSEHLTSASFDWLCEDDLCSEYLQWFCDTVQSDLIVSADDRLQYNAIEDKDKFESDEIEGILQCTQFAAKSEGDSMENISDLELLSQKLAKKRRHLEASLRILDEHNLSVLKTSSDQGDLMVSTDREVQTILDNAEAFSKEVDNESDAVFENLLRLVDLRCSPDTQVSAMPLKSIQEAEEKFSVDLTQLTKKLFFKGIATVAGADDADDDYKLLDIRNPESACSFATSGDDSILSDCSEVDRLQQTYPKAEATRINALVKENGCREAFDWLAEQCVKLQAGQLYTTVADKLAERLRTAQVNLNQAEEEVKKLVQEEIPSLIQQSANLQRNKILTGNYELKLARQQYFNDKQDQIIAELVSQRSRCEFVRLLHEVEKDSHQKLEKEIGSVLHRFQDGQKQHERHMELLQDPLLTPARHNRATLDSRDLCAQRLARALGTQPSQQWFVSWEELVTAAQEGRERAKKLKPRAHFAQRRRRRKLEERDELIQQCAVPVQNPCSAAQRELEEVAQQLERTVQDIMTVVTSKRKALKMDPLQLQERSLFVDFLTNPTNLRATVNEVTSLLARTAT